MNDLVSRLGLQPREVSSAPIAKMDAPLNVSKAHTFADVPHLYDYFLTVLAARDGQTKDANGRTADGRGVDNPRQTRGTNRRSPNGLRLSLIEALRTRYSSDAHCQPMTARALEEVDGSDTRTWRLNQQIFQHRDNIPISYDVLIYDWDKKEKGLSSTWKQGEFSEHVREWIKNPTIYRHAIIYQTKHGARFVFPLQDAVSKLPGVMVSSVSQWKAFYTAFADRYLTPVWGEGRLDDTSDAPRLFRLPSVYRSEEHWLSEIWYNEANTPYVADFADFPSVARIIDDAESVAGVVHPVQGLVSLFEDLGLIRGQRGDYEGVTRYDVLCPLGSHDSENLSSTSLLVNEDGSATFCCLHETCASSRGGRWRQQLQRKYPESWKQHIGGLSRYRLNPLDLRDLADKAAQVLDQAYGGRAFLQDGKIKIIRENVWGQRELCDLTSQQLWGLLNLEAQWEVLRPTKEGGAESVQTLLKSTQVQQIYDHVAYSLRPLRGFTSVPPQTGSGEITRTHEGYCERTNLYFMPAEDWDCTPLELALSKSTVTLDDAEFSARKILEIFDDFPFEAEEQKLLVLSMILTIARRKTLEGPAPFYMAVGNQPSVGKGKLMQTAINMVTGHSTNLTPSPFRQEEMEKVINSALLMGREYLVIDNIVGAFGNGGQIDAALTADAWSMRVLGESRMVDLPVRTFFGGTGNNVRLGGDTWRRVMPISLTYLQSAPESRRGFRYADILSEAKSRSSEIWGHISNVLRGYEQVSFREKERVRAGLSGYGSFEVWSRFIREPVAWVAQRLFPNRADLDLVNLVREKVQEARDDEGSAGLVSHLYSFQLHWGKSGQTWWSSADLVNEIGDICQRIEIGECGSDFSWAKAARTHFLDLQTSNKRVLSSRSVGRILGNAVNGTESGFRLKRKRGAQGTVYRFDLDGPGVPLPDVEPSTPHVIPLGSDAKTETTRIMETSIDDCAGFSPLKEEIPKDVEHNTMFHQLKKRCSFLSGEMCSRYKIPCEYPDADGGLSRESAEMLLVRIDDPAIRRAPVDLKRDPIVDQLKRDKEKQRTKLDEKRAKLKSSGYSVSQGCIDLIRAQYAMRRTLKDIADTLNAETAYEPPKGRKWTGPKVSAVVSELGLKRAPAVKRSKVETILKTKGSYTSWPESAPKRSASFNAPGFYAVSVEPSIQGMSATELLGGKSILADMEERFVTEDERRARKEALLNK